MKYNKLQKYFVYELPSINECHNLIYNDFFVLDIQDMLYNFCDNNREDILFGYISSECNLSDIYDLDFFHSYGTNL